MSEFVLILFMLVGGEAYPVDALATFASSDECYSAAGAFIDELEANRATVEAEIDNHGVDGVALDCIEVEAEEVEI